MTGICIRLAHGKLIIFIFFIKTESKTENIGVTVGGRSVIKYMTCRHPLPARPEIII